MSRKQTQSTPKSPHSTRGGSILRRLLYWLMLPLLLLFAALGCCAGAWGTTTPHMGNAVSIRELDAKAQPYFKQAKEHIPAVVKSLTSRRATLKTVYLMTCDKVRGTRKTAEYLDGKLEPILKACNKGAEAYGCKVDSDGLRQAVADANGASVKSIAYAASGLALEAIFYKSLLASLSSVYHAVITKLAASWGNGITCAAADGTFPVGDVIGLGIAITGTVWCACDIWKAGDRLSAELTRTLEQSVDDCRDACRRAVCL